MPTFRLTIAYDGSDFVGWQRQASGVSIQGLLEDALRELDDRYVVVTGAGRTDAGVHALGTARRIATESGTPTSGRRSSVDMPGTCWDTSIWMPWQRRRRSSKGIM